VNSRVEAVDENKVKLSIDVDEDEFDAAVDAAFKRIAREVRIPGFRPGKAPRKLLEAQFGHQVGREEALRESLPDYYARAVVEHDIDVIASPEIEITGGQESGPVSFDATVEIRPTVNAAGYNGLRVEIPSPEVTDDEIDEQLDRMRAQFAELSEVDRPAIDGDHVTIDITGTFDGEEVSGLTTTDYDYEVGTGAVVEEIDVNLRGSKPGEILEFDAAHPDPDEDGSLHFRVLVKDVREAVLPDVDDEFAAENSEFDTADELVDDIRKRMSAMKIAQSRMALQQNTAEALAELIDAEIPEAMIQSEINARVQDFAARIEEQGVDIQEYLERVGKTGEELVAEFREPASNAVRIDLGLRAVADAEDLWPDDEAIDAEIEQALGDSDQEVSEVRQRLADAGQLSALRADLAKRAAVEWLTDNVELVDENGDPVDRDLLEFPEIAADEDDDSDGGADSADEDDDSDVIEVSADDSTDDSTDEDDEADGESE
jgi:trigger factor